MTLTLEIGKYYIDGFGNVRGPMVFNVDAAPYIFTCYITKHTYTLNGVFGIGFHVGKNLIREVNADGSEIVPVQEPEYDPVKVNAFILAFDVWNSKPKGGSDEWIKLLSAWEALTPPKLVKRYTTPEWGELKLTTAPHILGPFLKITISDHGYEAINEKNTTQSVKPLRLWRK
jgi:hypothetical protein